MLPCRPGADSHLCPVQRLTCGRMPIPHRAGPRAGQQGDRAPAARHLLYGIRHRSDHNSVMMRQNQHGSVTFKSSLAMICDVVCTD